MWALTPDTEGVGCDCGDAVGEALCLRPDLRGLNPDDLGHVLGVSTKDAHAGIQRLAHDVARRDYSPAHATIIGSFDHVLSKLGTPAPKGPVIYAPDASGFGGANGFGDAGAVIKGELEAVVERDLVWEVVYSDGTDEIPKDPVAVEAAAALVEKSDPAMAARLRTYAHNIRVLGQPMPDPEHGKFIVYAAIGVAVGLFALAGFR